MQDLISKRSILQVATSCNLWRVQASQVFFSLRAGFLFLIAPSCQSLFCFKISFVSQVDPVHPRDSWTRPIAGDGRCLSPAPLTDRTYSLHTYLPALWQSDPSPSTSSTSWIQLELFWIRGSAATKGTEQTEVEMFCTECNHDSKKKISDGWLPFQSLRFQFCYLLIFFPSPVFSNSCSEKGFRKFIFKIWRQIISSDDISCSSLQ